MRKNISINGVSFTDIFTPTGYTVSYQKRHGNNDGLMLDGSQIEDVRAVKAVVTCYCMPTDEAQLQQLLTVLANTYVTLNYFDPRTGAYRVITAIPSEPSQKYRGRGINSLEYWTGTVVTFTEK